MHINKFLYFGDFFAIPIALAAFASYVFVMRGLSAAPQYALGLAAGVLAWTLAEYWIHRTIYHHTPIFREYHDRHHDAPTELIGLPSFLSSGIVVLIAYCPLSPFAPVFGAGLASGALVGYAAYMVVHHATHHWPIAPGDWLYSARVRHLAHHYHDDANFGVVTGVWDRVFGTTGRRRGRLAGGMRLALFALGAVLRYSNRSKMRQN